MTGSLPTAVHEGKSKVCPPLPHLPICIFISAVYKCVYNTPAELRNAAVSPGKGIEGI